MTPTTTPAPRNSSQILETLAPFVPPVVPARCQDPDNIGSLWTVVGSLAAAADLRASSKNSFLFNATASPCQMDTSNSRAYPDRLHVHQPCGITTTNDPRTRVGADALKQCKNCQG